MSATLIDTPADATPADNAEAPATLDTTIDVVQPEPTAAAEVTPTEPDLPPKYAGKSITDVIEMHQNAEKLAGRQSSEVGELRKIVDDFITTQSATTTQPEEDPIDFLDDPEKAIQRAIDNHPVVKQASEVVADAKVSRAGKEAQDKLLTAHPDTADIVGDENFVNWITASPTRTNVLRQANQSNDVDSMSMLLTEWKQSKPTETTVSKDAEATQQQAKAAAATGAITGGAGESRKVYRRADLIKLNQTDPDRYRKLQPEIMLAYKEKRVI
jgi:hypothetical protein